MDHGSLAGKSHHLRQFLRGHKGVDLLRKGGLAAIAALLAW
jgi:hypothetical protein